MHRTRHILAAVLSGAALAAAGCGDDTDEQPTQTNDSVVQEDTPAGEQGQTQPPTGSDPETRTNRNDGE